jgi:hypothetical protein
MVRMSGLWLRYRGEGQAPYLLATDLANMKASRKQRFKDVL